MRQLEPRVERGNTLTLKLNTFLIQTFIQTHEIQAETQKWREITHQQLFSPQAPIYVFWSLRATAHSLS